MFNIIKKEIKFGEDTLTLETGKVARQAHGSIIAKMGDTVVLCTAVGKKEASTADFFPLTVHYQERFYSDGRIPGGFIKRESKPSERETLVSRLIDRPIRPLFPKGYHNEVQVICTVMSYDKNHEPDIIGLIGASAALAISGIPFAEPIAAARVGYKDGEFKLNPTIEEIAESELELMVAGTKSSVLMVESEAQELSEEKMLEAVMFGHKNFQPVIQAIHEMVKEVGNEPWKVQITDLSELKTKVKAMAEEKIAQAYTIVSKSERKEKLAEITNDIKEAFVEEEEYSEKDLQTCIQALEKHVVREQLVDSHKRIDGRKPNEVRQIECELDVLPNVHGSVLFTRGETQAVGALTLGTGQDAQKVDDLAGNRDDRFMLHYNFPPYSVGECGMMRAPGRREIGHGKLANRAIQAILPTLEEFPYSLRMVSEITESNGSSSMATVCAASLALMAAGVPTKGAVSGIAMGLVKEGDKFEVLSDISGDEDHLGDMDFKVAGTDKGITALQMDIKINGISAEIMQKALEQAKEGRTHILSRMNSAIDNSRTDLHPKAPRIEILEINKDKIRDLIGPGGKNIKEICEKANAKVDITDDGIVSVAACSGEDMQLALKMVKQLTTVPKVGEIYEGKISKILDFGAMVEILGGAVTGLVHVSEIAAERVEKVSDHLSEDTTIKIKIIGFDRGKYKFSIKALLAEDEAPVAKPKEEKKISIPPATKKEEEKKPKKVQPKEKKAEPVEEEKPKKKRRFF